MSGSMRSVVTAIAVAIVGTISAPRDSDAQDSAGSCIECHLMLSGSLADPIELFADDVHAAAGFGCSACHGGDPTVGGAASMDPAAGFIGTPDHSQIPELCGRCHSNGEFMRQYDPSIRIDQLSEYVTSVHGQQLFGKDDQAVATCASCHGAHGIRPASDPRSSVHPLRVAQTCGGCHADESQMAPYGIPTDQLDLYESSVHWRMMSEGGDLSAPTCNDCHGNHGAVPPGVAWVGSVCGQCHVVMAEAFDQSQHSRTFTALGVPGCAFCHKNHEVQEAGDELLGLDDGAVCSSCHSSGDPGGQSATRMRGSIDTLRVHIDSAAACAGSSRECRDGSQRLGGLPRGCEKCARKGTSRRALFRSRDRRRGDRTGHRDRRGSGGRGRGCSTRDPGPANRAGGIGHRHRTSDPRTDLENQRNRAADVIGARKANHSVKERPHGR